jgi:hypothetical protein
VFELQGSASLTADVIANFADEGLARHIDVAPGASTVQDNEPLTPAIVLAGGSATTGAGSNGTGTPTPTEVTSVVQAAVAGGFGIVATPAAAAVTPTVTPVATITAKPTVTTIKGRLLTMRLVHPAHSKAYILVKVQSGSKTAKIQIALRNKHGKVVGKITKTIAANKLVKIQSSLIKLNVLRGTLISVK